MLTVTGIKPANSFVTSALHGSADYYSTVPSKRGVQIVGGGKNLENLISGRGQNKRVGLN